MTSMASAASAVPVASRSSDRKSTRLNSSHGYISYAVFCLQIIEEGLHTLGVVEPAVHASPKRCSNDERAAELAIGAVADLGCLVHDLIEGRVDVIGELHLGDRLQPVHRGADRESGDAKLGERGRDDAGLAEPLLETVSRAEDPAVLAYFFSRHGDGRVLHSFPTRRSSD